MQAKFLKRSICLLLTLVMVFSLMPVQAFATETGLHNHENDTVHSVLPAEESQSLYQQLQEQVNAVLLKYIGSTTMSAEEAVAAVYTLDNDGFYGATDEIYAMLSQFEQLTEVELQVFGEENPSFVAFADTIHAANSYDIMLLAASGTVLNNQITISDTASNVSISGNTATITIKGSGGLLSGNTSSNTITVTNTSGSMAMISFDYACSASGTYTFSESSHSGSYSGMLAAGESVTMTMSATGGALFSSSTATLKLANFSLTVAKEASNVTIGFDNTKGSVTADGAAVSSGTTLEGITPTTGTTLVASPASGYGFVCWVDPRDNRIISYDANYKLQPEDDVSLEAVFAKKDTEAFFSINKVLYPSLDAALTAAKSGDVIVLVGNGALTKDYTIPNDITLLIPFDEYDTVYTTTPGSSSSSTTPSAYRTLTMTAGANLTVNGTMSVPAKHNRNSGRPVETYGHVVLNEGSSIKVNGKLYAYGFISGKGTVKIMSGASVYEYFQIIDFRGGTATLSMYGNSREVFPLSQYYVQNVEAPMTLEAGATEYGYTTLYMNSTEYHSSVKFISTSGAMFNLTSGSVIKQYDGTTDRLIIKANGTMELKPLSLSISSMSINSSDYVLPINSSISIELEGGTATIHQDLALLPEAQLIIHSGATCKLASGVQLYVYDYDQWGAYVYSGAQLRVVPYAAGRTFKSAASSSRTVSRDAQVQIAGTLDASAGKLYTTESGAAITGVEGGKVKMASVSSGSTYQATQSGSAISYATIAVTSAKLLNADSTYTSTSANTYAYEDGQWTISCDHSYSSSRQEPTCTEDGSITYTCSKCGRSYSEPISATGHTAGQAVTENTVAATCTTDGSYDSVVYCSKCGAEMSREKVTTEATGHSYDDGQITTNPTCLTAGVKTFTCPDCGDSYTEAVDALGHEMVYTEVQTPTCTQEGQSARAYCSRCDYVEESGGTIPALGHDWKETSNTAATCTETGSTSYQCSRCTETKLETTDALGHQYSAVVTAPTCEEKGYTTHTCSVCNHSYQDSFVVAKGHTYTGVVTEPTCEETGFTTYTCSVCGDSYVDDETSAKGHSYGDGSVTLIATCTEAGNRKYTCSVCDDSYDDVIPALGHDLTQHAAKLASYTSVGWDAYEECSACDHTTYKEYPILSRESISDYDTFLKNLLILEQIADQYAAENPTENPAELVLNYIRYGVAGYTTTDWVIMAGNEKTDFTAYVTAYEDAYNTLVTDPADMISVVSLRDLEHFATPNDPSFKLEFSHMFGTMDIISHNPGSTNHADVGGWSGDLVDLLDLMDTKAVVTGKNTVEEMVAAIFENEFIAGPVEAFGRQDVYGDLDAFYIMTQLRNQAYTPGLLTEIMREYFVPGMTDEYRAAYFLANRMNGITNREQLRSAVYQAYVGNKLNTTLEATRSFGSDSAKLYDLRMACCYAFADYLWQLAGDYVEDSENTAFTVTSSDSVTLAPGITRQANTATTAGGEKLTYFVTVADLSHKDVQMASVTGNGTLLTQAQNYDANVIAAINAGAIGTGSYENSTNLAEVLTGTALVQNGKNVAPAGNTRIAGTAAGITKTGKAVLVAVDHATTAEMAQILLDAGCVTAVLLDSGSKTSFVSRPEDAAAFTDHTNNEETVGSVLLAISSAPDDTAFDHALLDGEFTYLMPNTGVQLSASGVTARGTDIAIPEGTLTWSVSDDRVGTVNASGMFTAAAVGETEVSLHLDGKKVGSITMYVVLPDILYFTSNNINAYFGKATALPLAAQYQRNPVAIHAQDILFSVSENDEGISGGSVAGFDFTGNVDSGLRTIHITAALAQNANINDTVAVTMYNPGDVAFDFDNATGGSRQLAWQREVSNATTEDGNTYYIVDSEQPMVVDYTLAIDMSAIEVPEQLKELTSMLPGADSTDGSAWGFLLQLADRVSELSEVKAEIQMDPNFNLDLSELRLQNEYFKLTSQEFDETTNTLTVTLNWIKQATAIDPVSANPICVVSGIKQTPKETNARNVGSSLTPVNSGTLSYEFYLSAGALHTFASDAANQTQYGLTPYINPSNPSDKGASFGSDYTSFQDSYTLITTLKNGWYFEEGKNVFYVDGVLHTEHIAKESVAAPPTCTEGGYTTNVCAICEITYITDETEALGHEYTKQVKDAAYQRTMATKCTEFDTYWYACSRCDTSAGNDSSATDRHWTSEDAGAHNFTEKLTGADHHVAGTGIHCQSANQYYYDCEYCDTMDSVAWTSNAYGNHDYDLTQWGFMAAEGHAHVCKIAGCGGHDTVIVHTPNIPEATEFTAKVCNDCDFVIEPKKDHVHVWSEAYTSENGMHFRQCSGCNETIDKGTCSGGNATCLAEAVCLTCGNPYGQKAAHTLGVAYENGNSQHWKKCTVVGCDYITEKVNCSGGSATCQAKAWCITCQHTYGDLGAHDLVHVEELKATCSADGHKEYWSCQTENCGKHFSDADGNHEIDLAIWLVIEGETGGKLTKLEHNYVNGECEHCGKKELQWQLGDLDHDGDVDNEDVIYLLWYTLFPEDNPIDGFADFDHDGDVDNEDVIYLLWHTLFPDDNPLTTAVMANN